MSADLLDRLMEQLHTLSAQEKRIIATRLMEESREDAKRANLNLSDEVRYRKREYQWLKEHRHEYPGQHVALEGDQLIAHGANLRQVIKEAREAGAKEPFYVYIESPKDSSAMF